MYLSNIRNLPLLVSVVFSTTLIGCASAPPAYVEPEVGSPQAKLRMVNVNEKAYYVAFATFEMPSCSPKSFIATIGEDQPIDTKRVGMLGSSPPSIGVVERVVKADEQLIVGPSHVWRNFSFVEGLFVQNPVVKEQHIRPQLQGPCPVPSFVPKSGEEYELVMEIEPGVCNVNVFELRQGSDGVIERKPLQGISFPVTNTLFKTQCTKSM